MDTLKLLETNSRYLDYQGKPTMLIGSGEHYGAVLNLDFDYVRYLDALAAGGLNLTRTFCGTYRENPDSFAIAGNTLAPKPGRFCCAWADGEEDSAVPGEKKFDLTRCNEAFFARLKDFLHRAEQRGIFVELVLFCYLYNPELWRVNPMAPQCNVNGIGAAEDFLATYDPDNAPLMERQLELVRRIATECNGFSNVYYELMNEPYSLSDGRDYDRWQNLVAEAIVATERELPRRHLIARNYQNRTQLIQRVHPGVSILNFHYAEPSAVHGNCHFNLPVADDETGFKGQSEQPYRQEAWRFMLSGGAIFSHLDYSFTCASPEGAAAIEGETPGGGGSRLRSQLRVLKDFMEALPIERMRPLDEACKFHGPHLPDGSFMNILSDGREVFALYLTGGPSARFALGMPAGRYRARWIRPADGGCVREETIDHPGPLMRLQTPLFSEDIALLIRREG